jgi:sulfopyruvate decarboxylase subunit alpha
VVEVTSVGVRSFEYRIISVSLSPRRERGGDVGRGPAALGVCSRRVSPVSAGHSKIVYDALKACGIRVMSALPETWLVHLIRMAEDDPDVTLVRLAKEEEGVGISAGAHLAGVKSAMLMQNHGFLAAVNGIVSCAQLYRIPLLMLISYRGTFGERDPWQTEGGGVTEDVLKALRIPYLLLDDPAHVARRINQAQTLAQSSNKPVALLLCRDLMWEEPS